MDLQLIQQRISEIRGTRVIFDFHLAELYQVDTRTLKQSVKRNRDRFPEDFMIEVSKDEWKELITNCDNLPESIKFSPAPPFAFTEQGVAMTSSILKSKTAIQVNIAIMRAFVIMRQMLIGHEDLLRRIEQLETSTDVQFSEIYQALTELASKKELEEKPRRPIGYNAYNSNDEAKNK
jgi:ORF6N domain.